MPLPVRKKEMKKEFAKLSRVEQEKVELEYHRMKPAGFDRLMAGAKPHSPDAIRLPKECIYCGATEKLTKDHIPPKNLFAKPRPTNLITVPCCQTCNESFSQDDEYLQMIMHTRLETGGHPELLKLKGLAKSLKRQESIGFHKRIRDSIFTAEVVSKETGYISDQRRLCEFRENDWRE